MSRKSKGKRQLKKTPTEVKGYQNFIKESSYSPDSTVPVNNEFLQGSAEWGIHKEELDAPEKIKRTPAKYRFADWIKNNIFPTIITTIVVAIGSAVITHYVNIAVINQKIEHLENQVEQIEDDTVDKELLNSKLSEIESKLDSSYSLTLNDIKWQLKQLEEKISGLSSVSKSEPQ